MKFSPNTESVNTIARFLSYIFIFLAYVKFMDSQLRNGFGWADYHAYRIFNAVEYLRVNG
jgi:hypothetical protein